MYIILRCFEELRLPCLHHGSEANRGGCGLSGWVEVKTYLSVETIEIL